jgi:hypothetical protein
MSRGVPSLKYLAELSTMLIAWDEEYDKPAREGKVYIDDAEVEKAKQAWDEIMELARVHGLVVVKKEKKSCSRPPQSESSPSPDPLD